MSFSTQHIGYLERSYLNALQGKVAESTENVHVPAPGNSFFVKVLGIADFWSSQETQRALPRSLMQDINAGLYGQKIPLIFLIIHEPSRLNLFIGTYQGNHLSTIAASLQSAYPGIDLQTQLSKDDLALLQNLTQGYKYAAIVTGSPTVKTDRETANNEQIERLIRGLNSATASQAGWAYMVMAVPASEIEVEELYNSTVNERRIVENAQAAANVQNPIAETYKERLESLKEKLELGKSQGLWHVGTYLLSQDSQTFRHGQAIIKAVFGGEDSRLDPIRVLEYPSCKTTHQPLRSSSAAPKGPSQNVEYPHKYLALENSKELAILAQLPTEEAPGYFVKDYVRFDVAVPDSKTKQGISVGDIIHCGQRVGNQYQVSYESLNRHGLAVGTTGSGKTNTIFHLLKQAWQANLPFLVIEPAKTEYRKALHIRELANYLRIFTLGDDTTSPFRLNPFEIMPGVSVQTHISHLLSVFNASFVMYAPMPYVLEACIHEIYQDKGWNLVTSTNDRGLHQNAHPTLTDLYRKIDEVVDRLGYEDKITMDVKAALKTRINSLRIGGKGLMLDTRKSIPIQALLQQPTILELEQIGDDDEKAFLIGLLLTFLCEYYTSQGLTEGKPLSHLTVIEEAHRLFKNVSTVVDTETANSRGKAVETFCNILSEIRAYGEGFLIAEQIPTKLAPDIIKNTNLKIMHRVVAADDRRVMGATMNLDEDQQRRIASLSVGEAAVYSEGDDSSLLIQVPYSKVVFQQLSKEQENQLIRQSMKKFSQKMVDVFAPLSGSLTIEDSLKPLKKEAEQIVENLEVQEVVARYVLSAVNQATGLIIEFPQLIQVVSKFRRSSSQDFQGIEISLIYGVSSYFERFGQKYGWQYEMVQQLTKEFLSLMSSIGLSRYKQSSTQPDLSGEEEQRIRVFQDRYRNLCSIQNYPFAGCERVCPDKICLYRHNVEPLLSDTRLDNNFISALAKLSGEEMWKQVAETCKVAGRRTILSGVSPEEARKTALCFAVQKSELGESARYMDAFLREKIINNMLTLL
ncbi:DUF87 domain-containing protein [Trichocoleus desertorum AS-A10]|uniref:ATP-binding protein n=1 Tax=Trichocoleus desertorum TaxID=1481672 RepID=UPI0032994F0E